MALPQNDAIIDAAENVRQIVEGDVLFDAVRKWAQVNIIPVPQLSPGVIYPKFDCNCPKYGTCMNTACPRAVRITNCVDVTA